MVVYVVKHVPNNESTRRHPPFRHLEVQRERTSIWCRTWSKMTRSQSPLARDTRTNFLEKDGWHEIAGKFTRTKNHHAPSLSYKILYTKPIFNRNNKAFNIKVHTVIDRCRFIVTHWNKCVTLKLFSRKCTSSWWWYFNLSDADYYNALNSVKALDSVPNSPPFPLRHDSALNAARSLTRFDFASRFLAKKNQFFPHAFALRYSNFKAFSFRNAKDVNFKFRYEYNNELTFSSWYQLTLHALSGLRSLISARVLNAWSTSALFTDTFADNVYLFDIVYSV